MFILYLVITLTTALSVFLLVFAFRLQNLNLRLRSEIRRLRLDNERLKNQLEHAAEKMSEYEAAGSTSDGLFQKATEGLVALGVPGLVLLAAVSVSGFTGAAALTTSLAAFGGPFGMIGGIGVLILLALVSKVIARSGFSKLAQAVVRGLIAKGNSPESIRERVDSLPQWLISAQLRSKIEEALSIQAFAVQFRNSS